jgi:CRP-like cAMP-binding protein
MIEKHLMKLRARDDITADEERALRDAVGEVIDYPADHTFITAGRELSCSTLLVEGFLCRYKDLSGGQRQITEVHVAGDFADLHSFTLKYLDHNVMALTPSKIVQVPHEKLARITEQFPHLARMLWFMTNMDAAIHREWEVSLGRRSALERTAPCRSPRANSPNASASPRCTSTACSGNCANGNWSSSAAAG